MHLGPWQDTGFV